jgi:hypothetical protein
MDAEAPLTSSSQWPSFGQETSFAVLGLAPRKYLDVLPRFAEEGVQLSVEHPGHDGHSMIERYRRKARTWNPGALGPLYALIPELAEAEPTVRIIPRIPFRLTARVAKLADAADLGSELTERDSPEIEKTRGIGDPSGPEIGGAQPDVGQSWGNQPPPEGTVDLVELELARALGKAADAARFDVVAQLAKELEARRLARLSNVVAFEVRGRRGPG